MTSLTRILLVSYIIVLVDFDTSAAQEGQELKTSLSRMSALAYTEAFPDVDRIELYTLLLESKLRDEQLDALPSNEKFKIGSSNGFGGADIYVEVAAHVTIDGKKCKDITDAWRSMTFQPNGAFCHVPPYGMQFFRKEKLLFETTVCWKCHNFYMPEIDSQSGEMKLLLYGFKDDSRAKKLLAVLQKHLPLTKTKK